MIRGEGLAALYMKKVDRDIFFSDRAWHLTITGMKFVGGHHQLVLGNNNSDVGAIRVLGSAPERYPTAVRTRNIRRRRDPSADDPRGRRGAAATVARTIQLARGRTVSFLAGCEFRESNGVAVKNIGPSCNAPSCPAPAFVGSFSTQLVVRECVFWHCEQALVTWSDWGVRRLRGNHDATATMT